MRLMINLYIFVILSFSFTLKAQVVNKSVTNFPVYQDTGNPQEDVQRYDIANKAWMAANPGAIPAMVNSGWQTPTKTETESKNATAEQKAATIPPNQHYSQDGILIDAPPKTANNAATQPIQKQTIPNDYPKLIDTGNAEEDHRRLDAAKQAWIAANPAVYANMVANGQQSSSPSIVDVPTMENKSLQTPSNTPTNNPIVEQKAVMIPPYNPNQNTEPQEMPVMPITEQISAPSKKIELPNDYPKYVDTGNQQQDQQKYDTAKQTWIATHKEVYENMNVINKQLIDKQEFDQMPAEKRQHILQYPDLYFIGEEQK